MSPTLRITAFFLTLLLLLAFCANAAPGKLGFTVDAKFDRKVLDADIKEVVVTNVARPPPPDAPA